MPRALAPGQQHRAGRETRLEHRLDVIALPAGRKRTHFCGDVLRIADANRARLLDQPLQQTLAHAALHQQTRTGHAALSGGGEDACDDRVADTLEVGVIEHQYRRFAAQFE